MRSWLTRMRVLRPFMDAKDRSVDLCLPEKLRPWALSLMALAMAVLPAQAQMGSVPKGWVPPGTPTPSASPVLKDAPHIQFVSTNYDFGDRDEGPDVTHLFRFRNTGRSPLKIGDVHASCGCTAAIATTSVIPPGGVGAIKATFHTQGRPGHSTKNISVNNNDPRNATVNLMFNINVVRDIDIQPDRAYFFGVKQGQSRSVTITVLGKPGRNLKLTDMAVRDKKVVVAQTPLTQASGNPAEGVRRGLTLVVTLPETLPIGEVSDEVSFKTNNLKKPELKIPVNGEVVGRVQAFPKVLYMNDLSQPQTVNLSVDPPEGFSVRSVTTEKGLVKPWVRTVPQPNGTRQYSVVVTPPPPGRLAPGEFNDNVILKTNDPKQEYVTLGVKGTKPAN